ncbi:hypothetical protein AJ80_00532 [Polytolypa hystricis UAMH7299]|uniref:Serine/threonine-protein phosphatase 2A activator n=1 Tax=Polytolypa hystricis (strain UAMH7299) TaxID=1447883 RepID=A0A2B7YUK1_POLH7|nr:hypothetical protein AJ80_00532 [Polytolypa hystricis UAMH7299]
MASEASFSIPRLEQLDPSQPHTFTIPSKKINEGQDVSTFLTSLAYRDLMTFILQLNRSIFPSKIRDEDGTERVQPWPLNSDAVEFSESIRRLQLLLSKLDATIEEVPPHTGPRRFGNISFRRWHETVASRVEDLLDECLLPGILQLGTNGPEESISAKKELAAYLMGSFGSDQRLDYGTGHELSFIAFLASIWKLHGFPQASPGVEERGIVLGVIEPYLELIRRIIKTYTLEPAGSHGVWGLDDHSFLPYLFGSAQLSPAISELDVTPVEGSLPNAPEPSGVAKANIVARERKDNMYFSAIGFIYDVKRGPFWEHSPMLYDISGIRDGWGKINKGMIKMYNAEVLSKFPVVQHFPFGSLFRWEHDPSAIQPPSSTHLSNQPTRTPAETGPPPPASSGTTTMHPAAMEGTKAPWATATPPGGPGMRAPPPATAAPWANQSAGRQVGAPPGGMPMTRAPWAKDDRAAGQ